MAKLPDVADHRQLQALGFPKRAAKKIARRHNRRAASPPSPSRTPGNPTSSRPRRAPVVDKAVRKMALALAGGEPIAPGDIPVMMAGADPELRQLYLDQSAPADLPVMTLDGERAVLMAQPDTDPELRRLFLDQQLATPEPAPSTAPLGMDDDRFQMHREAKLEAARMLARDPHLDPGEAYSRAVIAIDERDLSPI